MRRKTPELAIKEWDFRDCPKDELLACLHYECSREVDAARDYILPDGQRNLHLAAALGLP